MNAKTAQTGLAAIVLAGLLGWSGGSVAAASLQEVLAQTYQQNPELLSSRAELQSVAEEVPQAQSQIWRPQVTLTAGLEASRVEDSDAERAARGELDQDTRTDTFEQTYEYEIELPLYDATAIASVTRTRAAVRKQVFTLIETEQTVLKEAVTAYADVLYYRDLVRLQQRNVADILSLLEESRAMLQSERRTLTQVSQVEDELAQARSSLALASAELLGAAATFEAVVGERPETLQRRPELEGIPADLEQAIDLAKKRNPSLLAADREIDVREAYIDEYRGGIYPTVTLYHTLTRTNDKAHYTGTSPPYDELDVEDEFVLGLSVSFPLYQGGLAQSEVRQAKQDLSKARTDRATTEKEIGQKVRSTYADLDGYRQTLLFAEDQMAAADRAEEGSRFGLERGLTTMSDYLDSKSRSITAQQAVLSAERSILTTGADLLAAVGAMTARDQKLAVSEYDPFAYIRKADGRWFGFGE